MGHPHLGRFTQPRSKNSLAELAGCGMWWAADNDALAGLDVDAYLAMLDAIATGPRSHLLFVTAPDATELIPQVYTDSISQNLLFTLESQ